MAIDPFQLAEKIAQDLNAQAWTVAFRAHADFVPEYLLAADVRKPEAPVLDRLRVDVMPRKRSPEKIARVMVQRTYTFDVSFLKKIDAETDASRRAEVAKLLAVVQEVEAHLINLKRLPTHAEASIESVETDPVFDAARLRNHGEFASRIVLVLQTEGAP